MSKVPPQARQGRGAASNPDGRFEALRREAFDDGWGEPEPAPSAVPTTLMVDSSRSVLSHNESPDLPFDRSINPYRGCEHGCIYCYARPTHAWLGLSPGLDFETRLAYKPEAAALLRRELGRPGYQCQPLALGTNTDAYQPVERRLGITRALLALLLECRHPVTVTTKSALVERDLDLLGVLARERLVRVAISITTLQPELARRLEPRAPAPERRLATVAALADAGVPVGVMVAPVIPALTDPELERILERARAAGAGSAGYVVLRLPHEVRDLFREWLDLHAPAVAERVCARLLDLHGGKAYSAEFGRRMRGGGPLAELLAQRFALAGRRLGLVEPAALDTSGFRPPAANPGQLALF